MQNKKICFVVGGSGGMGTEICLQLAKNNYSVAIAYHDSKEQAAGLEDQIKKMGHQACCVRVDICQEKSVQNAVEKARDIFKGEVLHLVYTAGASFNYGTLVNLSWARVQQQLDLLTRGGWYCLKALLPGMEEAKFGRVVFVNSSVTWGTPPPSLADYVIGRYSQIGLMKASAVELGPKGITVNCVSPGLTEVKSIADIPDIAKRMAASQNPLRRLALPADIANAVIFLLREGSAYLNGVDIPVSGGSIMR